MEQKLGRGLAALLGGTEMTEYKDNALSTVDINLIYPNKEQPRKEFDAEKLEELAQSIKLYGVLQPIAVRQVDDKYEIIAGERRWRAAGIAKIQQVPVHIVACNDSEVLTFSLIENIQRSDLNPIEEAVAIQSIIKRCDCRQEDLSEIVGKSRSYVANSIRLLSLPESVQLLIKEKKITAGHGKCLVGVENAEEIAKVALEEGWNVRQLERAVKDLRVVEQDLPPKAHDTPIAIYEDPDAVAISERIASILGVQAKLKITKKGGVLTLTCQSCESLEVLTALLLSISSNVEELS